MNGQMCMTDAGTTQYNFVLPAPPVGGLPISQDWLDRMKLVRNRTIPIILPNGKNILVRGKSNADLTAKSAFSLPLMPVWLDTQQKTLSYHCVSESQNIRDLTLLENSL